MDIHSSHDIKFTIERRRSRPDGKPQPLYPRENIATADLGDGVTLSVGQSLSRLAFFVENDAGDMVLFNVRELIDVAAHVLVNGHPAERGAN